MNKVFQVIEKLCIIQLSAVGWMINHKTIKTCEMAPRKTGNIYVIPHDNSWAVRREGECKISSVHNTQRDAIAAAKKIAQKENGQLLIHARDGRIRERVRFNFDPLPPKSPRKVLFPKLASKTKEKAIRKAIREVLQEAEI